MPRPRIRSLKPDIWEHEKIYARSRDERLLFIGLVTMADDEGRLRELPQSILGHVYPRDNLSARTLERWLVALDGAELIRRYVVDGASFIQIHGWKQHQRVDKGHPSDLPAPPEFQDRSTTNLGGIGGDRKGRDRNDVDRARELVSIFAESGLELSEVDAVNAVRRFPSLAGELEQLARGCVQWLRDNPGKPVGHTLHRYFEQELKDQRKRAEGSGEGAAHEARFSRFDGIGTKV